MTTHCFDRRGFTVHIGWDRQLQGFFMTVTRHKGNRMVYSNLNDPILEGLGGMSDRPEYFFTRLKERGFSIPDGLLEALEADRRENKPPYTRQWE